MVGILLKKQMAEIFRTYFYNQKTNARRSKATTIAYFALYAVLIVGVFGGIFGFVAYMLCGPLCSLNLGWMYFVIMGFIAIALGAFGSVFNTYAGLYLAKDNDFLLSLPIPISAIMASRLLGVYLMGLMYSGMVSLSSVVVYLIFAGFSVSALSCGLIFVFTISIIVLLLSCLLGWVVARLSQKLKNKSYITVLVSLIGIGIYYFCYFKAQSVLQNLLDNALTYGEKLKGSAYFLYIFGRAAEGSWLATAGCLALVGIAFALIWLLLKRSFLKVATGSGVSTRRGYKKGMEQAGFTASGFVASGIGKRRRVGVALFCKELGRLTASATYMLNCSMGTLMLVAMAVAMGVKADFVQLFLAEYGISSSSVLFYALCLICAVAGINNMAAPSISLEGKSLWIMQALPVRPWDVLKAKLSVQLLLTSVPSVLCVIVMAVVGQLSAAEFILSLVLILGYVLLMALFDLFVGLKFPNFTWTSEQAVVKQGLSVFLAMFGGWVYVGLFFCLYLFFGKDLSSFAISSIFTGATWLLCFVLATWLRKKGSALFSRL